MSYESIASSVFTNLRSRLREVPSRLTSPVKRAFGRSREEPETSPEPQVSSETSELAANEIESFVRQNITLFERMDRWTERVKRLRKDGISSESAANRANRAREEAVDGLDSVRRSFVSKTGEEGARAFDAELRSRYPELVKGRSA